MPQTLGKLRDYALAVAVMAGLMTFAVLTAHGAVVKIEISAVLVLFAAWMIVESSDS